MHDVEGHRPERGGEDDSTQAYNYYYPVSWGASYVGCIVSIMEQRFEHWARFSIF